MNDRKSAVDLVYASALWFASTKVNCHHLAERLAQEHRVLFVESVGARLPRFHEWKRLLPRLLRALRPLRKVSPRIWVFSPLPMPLYRGRGAELNSAWVGLQVKLLLALRRWATCACWVFHPMGLGTARAVRSGALFYYCVDDYSVNPGVERSSVRRLEDALAERADAILVTGEPLLERFRKHGRKVRVMPNVADTELFLMPSTSQRHAVLDRIGALPSPRIGYVGNLAAYKIDYELVKEIAKARPRWSLVLVGPVNQGDIQAAIGTDVKLGNVYFLGAIPHRFVPSVIDEFDVCILPSAQHDVMLASFPLKFFEYLLRGRPVVARPIPTLRPFASYYAMANSADDFIAAIEENLRNRRPDDVAKRVTFAKTFSWTERMKTLRSLRSEVLQRHGVARSA